MIIKTYEVTSNVAPTQIEGTLEDGRDFYLRYRNCMYYAEIQNGSIKNIFFSERQGDYEAEVHMKVSEMFEIAGFKLPGYDKFLLEKIEEEEE
jgi:hypothetical protein